MINLIELYKQLKQLVNKGDTDSVRFSACPIPGYENHRLARDVNNYPCLLISTQDAARNRPAPIKLEHLQVLYDINCRILHNDLLEENRFTVICCTELDLLMQEYFLRTSSTIISAIGNNPTHLQVTRAVGNLVELFRVINNPPRKSVQGLWAELLIISLSVSPIDLIKAWHKSPNDKYDFSSENQRVEVKSSTSKLRQHHFSFEQLKPSEGLEILIASVFVERVGAGTSLAELADQIRSKLNKEPELLLYIDQIIGITLGNEWRSAIDDRFDLQLAKKSLAFYFSTDIPCIDSNFPKEINDIHFKVDLSNVSSTEKKTLKTYRNLFGKATFK